MMRPGPFGHAGAAEPLRAVADRRRGAGLGTRLAFSSAVRAARLRLVRTRAREQQERRRLGWVFAGGGARGAYEIGVASYVFDRVTREIGRPLPIDVVSGTSIGAIHASALAVWADDPQAGMKHLAARWTALSLEDVIRVDRRRTLNMLRALLGRPPRNPTAEAARGGILDPRPLETLLSSAVDFRRIDHHIAAGRLVAVSW